MGRLTRDIGYPHQEIEDKLIVSFPASDLREVDRQQKCHAIVTLCYFWKNMWEKGGWEG